MKKIEKEMPKKPIRVLQVLTIMNRGGAETMIMNYYRNIDRTKVQFDFLLHRKEEGAFDNEIQNLGGKIFRFDPISPLRIAKYIKELDDFFKNHKEYAIVHSHLNSLSYFVLKVAKKHNIQTRVSHSHWAMDDNLILKLFKKNTDRKSLTKDYIQHIIRKGVRKVSTHHFACGMKAGYWLFGNKINFQVINNAIDSALYSYNKDSRELIRQKLNIVEKKVIGHVGRFNEQKNHFFLIEIFNELLKLSDDYHLILIGDGNLKTKVKELVDNLGISSKVSFLGVLDNVNEVIQGMDYFVFPSIYEGLPVSLIEAQASGLKILASSNITKEVDLNKQINFMELTKTPNVWANKINNEIKYTRTNTSSAIKKSGYDIIENAKNMEAFYLCNQ